MVNRKTKKIEFTVHYKKTHTNITIKKKSNHRDSTKSGVIKGYVERARALCDKQYLEKELENIRQVFEESGSSAQLCGCDEDSSVDIYWGRVHDFKRSVVNVFWLTAMYLFYSSTSNSLAVPSTPVFSLRFVASV